MTNDDILDGCDLDFTGDDIVAADDEQVDAVVMFADVFDDPDAVAVRRIELIELDAALRKEHG